MEAVSSDDFMARPAEMLERAAAGEELQISRAGRPVAKLVPAEAEPKPFDWGALKAFTDSLPLDPTESVVEMRKQARF